jgi:hypothetical protein
MILKSVFVQRDARLRQAAVVNDSPIRRRTFQCRKCGKLHADKTTDGGAVHKWRYLSEGGFPSSSQGRPHLADRAVSEGISTPSPDIMKLNFDQLPVSLTDIRISPETDEGITGMLTLTPQAGPDFKAQVLIEPDAETNEIMDDPELVVANMAHVSNVSAWFETEQLDTSGIVSRDVKLSTPTHIGLHQQSSADTQDTLARMNAILNENVSLATTTAASNLAVSQSDIMECDEHQFEEQLDALLHADGESHDADAEEEAVQITADDLLPALAFVIIHANPPNIDCILWLAAEFRHTGNICDCMLWFIGSSVMSCSYVVAELFHGEERFCVSQIQSAVEFCR